MSLPEDAPFRSLEGMALRVLASGSAGNCSVLIVGRAGVRRACLIDLGLSPRRTVRLLADCQLSMSDVDDVLLTHLDADHFYGTWCRFLPPHVRVRVHVRHHRGAIAAGMPPERITPFDDSFVMQADLGGALVAPMLNAHDVLGSVSYRIDLPASAEGEGGVASLGFATDLGHVPPRLTEHLRGVDVLAIESNYCPDMQARSERPDYLKRRITGGAGHLSNQQSREAIREIDPRGHVVLLHLSRECNLPALAAREHAAAPYGLTISGQHEPTGWVPVQARPPTTAARCKPVQSGLFETRDVATIRAGAAALGTAS